MIVKIEICKGSEGFCVVLNDYRIAGNKMWGGGSIVKSWDIELKDIEKALDTKFQKGVK